jgi:hypothetical protein
MGHITTATRVSACSKWCLDRVWIGFETCLKTCFGSGLNGLQKYTVVMHLLTNASPVSAGNATMLQLWTAVIVTKRMTMARGWMTNGSFSHAFVGY